MRRALSLLGCVVALCGAISLVGQAAEGDGAKPTGPAKPTSAPVPISAGQLTDGGGLTALRFGSLGNWGLSRHGGGLPTDFEFLSGEESSRFEMTDGTIIITYSGARGEVHDAGKRIILREGTLDLYTAAEKPVSVEIDGVKSLVRGGSFVTFLRSGEPNAKAEVSVFTGEAIVGHGEQDAQKATVQSVITWQTGQGQPKLERRDSGMEEMVDSFITPPATAQGLGQLVVNDPQSRSPRRLNIARYHVNVVLQPPVALVQIDQSFYNPYSQQEEGTFVFNLPRGASVSRFAMYVTPQQLIEGELIERQRATQVYDSIVRAKRDPAILEQIGDDLFKMRVFPIFANDTKRILLDFTLPLKELDGQTTFQLPMMSDVKPIWDFRITGNIRCAGGVKNASSPTHPALKFTPRGNGSLDMVLEERSYKPKSDLVLKFSKPKAEGVEIRTFRAELLEPVAEKPSFDFLSANFREEATVPEKPQAYFLATLPLDKELSKRATDPADVLILADTSSGTSRTASLLPALVTLLDHLRPEDRFRLMAVDVAARDLSEGAWRAPGREAAEKAAKSLSNDICLGALEIAKSIEQAVQSFKDRDADRRRIVVFLGGGMSFREDFSLSDEKAAIAKSLADCKAFLVVVGSPRRDRAAGEGMFSSTRGVLSFDTKGGDTDAGELMHYWQAGMPSPSRIVGVECEGIDEKDIFFPPTLSPGEPLQILGRTAPDNGKIRMEATLECAGVTKKLRGEAALGKAEGDLFLGRLWAQQKLQQLVAADKASSATVNHTELRSQIMRLSREWSLLSPFTAFLVLESEADYGRFNIVRSQRRRYWKPAEAVVAEPLPPAWLNEAGIKSTVGSDRWNSERVAAALKAAREAVAAGNYALANSALDSLTRDALVSTGRRLAAAAAAVPEYHQLRAKVTAGLADQTRFSGALGTPADPARLFAAGDAQADVFALFGISATGNPDFNRRHPHATQLLKPIKMRLGGEIGLKELAWAIRQITGTFVMIDRKSIIDSGLGAETILNLDGVGTISLRSYVQACLYGSEMTMLEEPQRLVITTNETAEAKLSTEVQRLGDFLIKDTSTTASQLIDPYLDQELAAEAKIQDRLKRPLSPQFVETPLAQVAEWLHGQLDIPIVIDRRALDNIGLTIDVPVTADWRGISGDESLRWMLRDLELSFMIRNEALWITTPEVSDCSLKARLHSAGGIVLMAPAMEMANPASMMGLTMYFGGGGGSHAGGASGGRSHSRHGSHSMGGGMGGGMGGMGGGMGGMGGGMGGRMGGSMGDSFAGPVTPPIAPPAAPATGLPAGPSTQAALSEETPSGDQDAPRRANVPVVGSESDVGPLSAPIVAGGGMTPLPNPAQGAARREFMDYETVIDMITATVAPTTWDGVGGPGAIAQCERTLDMVVLQTDAIHGQLASILDRVRALPAAQQPPGVRLAELPDGDPQPGQPADFESMVDLITNCVAPTTWDGVGGPGSIAIEPSRCAIVISQSEAGHDAVANLLTMLRRSRYEKLHHQRPWLQALKVVTSLSPSLQAEIDAVQRANAPPVAAPEQLALLAVRRPIADGRSRYGRKLMESGASESFTLDKAAGAITLDLASAAFSADGKQGAAAYPDLQLKQSGPWGEAVRRLADAWLPWRPHRTNAELAGEFVVEASSTGPASDKKAAADSVRLKLVPRNLPANSGAWLDVAFARRTGEPTRWDYYEAGKLRSRLRFLAEKELRVVTLEDAQGKILCRWEMETGDAKTGKPAAADYLVLGEGGDADLNAATAAIGAGDWAAADAALVKALARCPKHPLLKILRAFCHDYEPKLADRALLVAQTREAVAVSPGLGRLLNNQGVRWLSGAERLEILQVIPEASRDAGQWEQIARAAADATRLDEALQCVRTGMKMSATDGRQSVRRSLELEILLKSRHDDEAIRVASATPADYAQTTEQWIALGGVAANQGAKKAARFFYQRAIDGGKLDPVALVGLLQRQAAVCEGLDRCRILTKAAVAKWGYDGSIDILDQLEAQLDAVKDPQVLPLLAKEAEEPWLKGWLLIRQARSVPDAEGVDLAWQAWQTGTIDPAMEDWAFGLWNRQRQPERTIRAAESRLRSGVKLSRPMLALLADAYLQVGSKDAALRAQTASKLGSPLSLESK